MHTDKNFQRNLQYSHSKTLLTIIVRSDNPASVRPLHELLPRHACGLPCVEREASVVSCPAKHGVGHEAAGSETGMRGVSQATPEKPARR